MAQPQTFIALENGRQVTRQIESINATAGAGDANKLIRTDTSGKLDPSLLPTGLGADALTIEAFEDLSGGDFVNVFDDGGVTKARKADASVAGKEADGFVANAILTGQTGLVYFEGRNSSLAALTVGARYYLSATTPGTATAIPPAGAGNVVQYLGRASTATSLVFEASEGVILG